MSATTLGDLVERVARRFGHYRSGTATGGSTTTIVDTSVLYEPDDFWVNHYAYITEDAGGASAAPEGEERPVSDFNQSSATITVDPAFTAAPASGDTYELLPCRRADIIAAINAAIRAAGDTWLVAMTDTSTVTIAADDYDYTLPTDVVEILAIWRRDGTDEPWAVVPPRDWWISRVLGAQVLQFKSLDCVDADDVLRIDYVGRLSELSADSDTLGIGEPAEPELLNFLEAWALYWLHDQAAASGPQAGDFRAHYTLAQTRKEEAEQIRKRAPRRLRRPGQVRGPRWSRSVG